MEYTRDGQTLGGNTSMQANAAQKRHERPGACGGKGRPALRAALVSGGVLALLLWFVRLDVSLLCRLVGGLDPWLLAGVVGIYLLGAVAKAARLRMLLKTPPGTLRVIGISLLHQFYATVLPFRSGEAALPVLARREGVSIAHSLGMLMVVRLLDLAALLACLLLGLAACWHELTGAAQRFAAVATGAGAAIVGVLAMAVLSHRAALGLVQRFLHHSRLGNVPRREWIAGRVRSLDDGFASLTRGDVARATCWSILAWAIGCLAVVILWGPLLRIPGSPAAHVGLALVMSLLSQIPVQGWAGLGTAEAIAVLVLTAAGVSRQDALVDGLMMHAVQLLSTAVLLPLGLIVRRCCRGNSD